MPRGECFVDLSGVGAAWEWSATSSLPGEHEDRRVVGGDCTHLAPHCVLLGLGETVERSGVEDEAVAGADLRGIEVGRVGVDEPDRQLLGLDAVVWTV